MMADDQGLSTVVELNEEGKVIKTTLTSKEINLDANAVEQKTASVDQLSTILDPDKNPFTSSGKLSRKADYILSHSTITRSELRISDPDVPSRTKDTTSNSTEPLLNGNLASELPIDEPLMKPVMVNQEEKEPTGLVNGYTGSPVEAEVSQVLLQMPEKDKAEQVKLESRKCSGGGCCKRCRQCCVVQ